MQSGRGTRDISGFLVPAAALHVRARTKIHVRPLSCKIYGRAGPSLPYPPPSTPYVQYAIIIIIIILRGDFFRIVAYRDSRTNRIIALYLHARFTAQDIINGRTRSALTRARAYNENPFGPVESVSRDDVAAPFFPITHVYICIHTTKLAHCYKPLTASPTRDEFRISRIIVFIRRV